VDAGRSNASCGELSQRLPRGAGPGHSWQRCGAGGGRLPVSLRHLPLHRQRKEKPSGAAVPATCRPAPIVPRHVRTREGESTQKNKERKGDEGVGQSFGGADTTKPSKMTTWVGK